MRIVNEKFETISESEVDLSKGTLVTTTGIREDAEPIDNITRFAWDDNDYEEVQMYVLNKDSEYSEPYTNNQNGFDSAQADTDAMMIDHEYRLTLLELGLTESGA